MVGGCVRWGLFGDIEMWAKIRQVCVGLYNAAKRAIKVDMVRWGIRTLEGQVAFDVCFSVYIKLPFIHGEGGVPENK